MQLRNRYFSYPVLVEGGDYYSDSSFSSSVVQTLEGYNVRLTINVNLKDELLLEMLKKGDVIYAHHIECPQTCYRHVFKTRSETIDCVLKDTDINGDVQVCSFIIANKNIEKYTNKSFSPDYRGWKFNIEKGCIVAVGSQYNLRVNKQRDDFSNASSIFSIVKNTDPAETLISVELGRQKIILSLPEITYNQYSSVQGYVDIQPVMHSMLIVPALTYTFTELRKAGEQLYEYEEYRWFRGLKKACSSIGIRLDEESLKNIDVVRVPQQLLNGPISKAIEYCAMGGGTYED